MSNDPTTSTHVVATDFDGGEGVLVDLNTKKYYQLNETAMLIWRGLSQNKPVQDIIAEVQPKFFGVPGVFAFATSPPAFGGFGAPVQFVVQNRDFEALVNGMDSLQARAHDSRTRQRRHGSSRDQAGARHHARPRPC